VGNQSHAGAVFVVYSRSITGVGFGLAAPGHDVAFHQRWTESGFPGKTSERSAASASHSLPGL